MSLLGWGLLWVVVSVLCALGWSRMPRDEGDDMGGASDAAGGGVSRIPYGGARR